MRRVFKGSAIGKQCSAKGILERCGEPKETPTQKQSFVKQASSRKFLAEEQITSPVTLQNKDANGLLETLLQPEHVSSYVPYQLTEKGGKKRKKRMNKRL